MGFDDLIDKAKDFMGDAGEKLSEAVDKATDFIDDKTGGKFSDKLEALDEKTAKLFHADDDDEPQEPPAAA